MMRRCIDAANAVVAWTKKSRRLHPKADIVRVNLGSSLAVTDGWFNVDGSPHVLFAGWPEPFLSLLYRASNAATWCGDKDVYLQQLTGHRYIHHDITYGVPFQDESVDYVFSSHVLEHFRPDAAERILADVHRALKKGGRCRICVPDLQYAFQLYQQGKKQEALGYFFSAEEGTPHQHRYMYDFDLLSNLLSRIGFRSIDKCSYRQGSVPDLDRLDNRPDETLYVECIK